MGADKSRWFSICAYLRNLRINVVLFGFSVVDFMGLTLLALSVGGLGVFGWGMALRWPGGDEGDAAEHLLAAATWMAVGAVGIGWVLSVPMALRRGPMTVMSLLLGAVGAVVWKAEGRRQKAVHDFTAYCLLPTAYFPLALCLLWLAFAVARTGLHFTVSWDAMTYHMTKVALMAQSGGIRPWETPLNGVAFFPFNATVLQGWPVVSATAPKMSAWAQTASWGLCGVACAALARRCWPGQGWAGTAAVAGLFAPLLLLESLTTQNDLIFAFFWVSAALWVLRYLWTGSEAALPLVAASAALLAGTKSHGPLWAFFLLAGWVATWRHRGRPRGHLLRLAALFVALLPPCGAWVYVWNWGRAGNPLGVSLDPGADTLNRFAPGLDTLGAGLAGLAGRLFLDPFRMSRASWFNHDLSNFGFLTMATVPVWVWGMVSDGAEVRRRRKGGATAATARWILGGTLLAGTLCFLSVHPHSVHALRLMVFWPVCLAALTVPRLGGWAGRAGRGAHVGLAALVLGVGAGQGVASAVYDTACPLGSLLDRQPGLPRLLHADFRYRHGGAELADRLAPARATIAVDADEHAWVYPLFGEGLTRRVLFLRSAGDLDRLPDGTAFLVVDRRRHPRLEVVEAALKRPDMRLVHYGDGEFLFRVGRDGAAWDLVRDYPLAEGDAGSHGHLAFILYGAGLRDSAVAEYRRAVRLRPDDAEMHSRLGFVLYSQGRADEAERAYREAIRADSDHAGAHNNLGNLLRDRGQLGEAMAEYREAIRIEPDHADAHNNLGAALAAMGRVEEAEGAYREAIRLRPDHAGAHNNLGNLLRQRGRTYEAVRAYREAIRVKPDYAGAHYNLGLALTAMGLAEEAVRAYREAIRLRPDHAGARYNLGMALKARGLTREAVEELLAYLRATEGRRGEERWRAQAGQAIREMGERP
jgi:tetratricopeptide (TPR) repeat protein